MKRVGTLLSSAPAKKTRLPALLPFGQEPQRAELVVLLLLETSEVSRSEVECSRVLEFGPRIRQSTALLPEERILVVPKQIQLAPMTAAVWQSQSVPVWIQSELLIYSFLACSAQPRWLAESHLPPALGYSRPRVKVLAPFSRRLSASHRVRRCEG